MKYKSVPKIITSKDLDYLSDMFNWNYLGYKLVINMEEEITDKNILDIIKQAANLFYDNMNNILDTINELGVTNE